MVENQSKPDQKDSITKWVALTVGGCLVLIACFALAVALIGRTLDPQVAGIFSQMLGTTTATPQNLQVNGSSPTLQNHPATKFNTMGDPNAPVKIIEYADFQCPFCMRYWQDTEPQIVQMYVVTGKVFYEYRSVGAFIGPDSASAAEAAYCAGDQGKFWEYHDMLFSNWSGENVGDFTPDKLKQYAANVGLDQQTFTDCLVQNKYAGQVQQDVANAKADGIHSTPSFLINGKLVEGAQPFDVFQQAIDAALKGN